MSYEGQAPPPGGFPPSGTPQTPQAPGETAQGAASSYGGYGQPAPYQQPGHTQPGQQAPGQYAPGQQAQGQYAPGQQPGQAGPGQQGQYAPAPHAPAPVAPRPNPFAGIPTADFVRDGVAALLLLVSFALPVTFGRTLEGIGDRYHFVVTLVTVLSVVSLALPYLARASVFPPTWTVHTTRLVRLLANAPYVVVVLVYVVLDAVTSDETAGVGTIFALGLAGALLAAQPRQCEMGPEDLDRGVSKLWLSITAGIGAFIALTYLASLVLFLIKVDDYEYILGSVAIPAAILAWIFAVAFSLWAVYGTVVQRSSGWRLVLIGIGVILVCAFVFGAGEGSSLVKIESLRGFGLGVLQPLSLEDGLGAIFVPAAAAAAASPAVLRAMHREPRAKSWITAAVHGLDYLALVAAATVVTSVLWFFVDRLERPTGVLVTTIVLALLILGAAVYARMALAKDPSASRILALSAAGAAFVLGLVIIIMVPTELFTDGKYITVGHLLLAFGLPALVAIALTAPKDVRDYFAANRPTPHGATNAAYQWTAPPAPTTGYQYPGQQGAAGAPAAPGAPQQSYGAPAQTGAWQTQGTPSGAAPQPSRAPEQAPISTPAEPAQAETGQYDTARLEVTTPQTADAGAPGTGAQHTDATTPQTDSAHTEQAHTGTTSQADAAPVAPAPGATASTTFTAAQALDPSTPGAVLAQIVQDAPELRPQVAANPATYPALLGWLAQLGDPEVDAALRAREN